MHDFGAQYKACMYPCPTLQVRPHDRPRMARGKDGSLFLSCTTLSFAASCRFIPALSTHECVRHKGKEHARVAKSRLKGGCRQDCLPHYFGPVGPLGPV